MFLTIVQDEMLFQEKTRKRIRKFPITREN